MGQFIFFALFVIALIAGIYSYLTPAQRNIDPMKFVMQSSGYNSQQSLNYKRIQELNLTNSKGLIQVHTLMDNLAIKQDKLQGMINDQQELLNNENRTANDILTQSQSANSNDLLQLKALTSQMQDEQRLLVAHGQELLVLNTQLMKDRQWISDQIDAGKINNESAVHDLKEHYLMLNDQTANFFDRVIEHNQEIRNHVERMKDQLNDLINDAEINSAQQQQNSKDLIQRMMDKEHQNILQLNDKLQQTQDLIEEQRQKNEDEQWENKQRIVDQFQRMQDKQ